MRPLPFHRLVITSGDELKSLTEVVNSTLDCIAEDGQAATHLLRLQKLLNQACKRKGIVPDDLLNTSEPSRQYCDRCDGCGWYEGGKAMKTTCERCGGTGVVSTASKAEAETPEMKQAHVDFYAPRMQSDPPED